MMIFISYLVLFYTQSSFGTVKSREEKFPELQKDITKLRHQVENLMNDQRTFRRKYDTLEDEYNFLLTRCGIQSSKNRNRRSTRQGTNISNGPVAAFTAKPSTLTETYDDWSTLKFGHLDLNYGGAFDNNTSIYTAKSHQICSFYLTVTSSGPKGPSAYIVKNGGSIAWLYGISDGSGGVRLRQASVGITAMVNQGDRVWARWHGDANESVFGSTETQFSGQCFIVK